MTFFLNCILILNYSLYYNLKREGLVFMKKRDKIIISIIIIVALIAALVVLLFYLNSRNIIKIGNDLFVRRWYNC